MRPIVALMLAVQAAIVLVSIYTMLTTPAAEAQRRRAWSGLVIALVIIAGASWNIGESRAGEPGADILMYVSPLLLGMAIMVGLFALRKRRGLD